ncbi:hypothetical protein H920_00103 [Fukomys damarensis]|uniref:Uncharacterized protein n=1 Tax=Fukomys damarensis TaxID=885580 RepID=A0A091E247_FUKDA|nr:hypothetical protein H920_00103 [Fukomys damarensis]
MKDLCHQPEGSTLEPGSDIHSKGQSSPDESSRHSQMTARFRTCWQDPDVAAHDTQALSWASCRLETSAEAGHVEDQPGDAAAYSSGGEMHFCSDPEIPDLYVEKHNSK